MTKSAAQLISAKPLVASLLNELQSDCRSFLEMTKRKPKLVVIIVGDDPASLIYTSRKTKMAEAVGMAHETVRLSATSTPVEVKTHVKIWNDDPETDGILIQRPLPKGFHESELVYLISPEKDVDGFHPENLGKLALGQVFPDFQDEIHR